MTASPSSPSSRTLGGISIDTPQNGVRHWYGVAALTLIGLFAMVDRQVFVLLADPIKKSLSMSDFQLGLLHGFGIGLFTALAAYPFGWLADRVDRRKVLALGVLIWGLAVFASSTANSFAALFVTASLVAAGEAAALPVGVSLIADWFVGPRRLLANSVFIVSGRLAAGVAIALCGQLIGLSDSARGWMPAWLAGQETWRFVLVLTAATLPLLLVLCFTMPAAWRGGSSDGNPAPSASRSSEPKTQRDSLWAYITQHPRVFTTYFASLGLVGFGFSAVATWMPIAAGRVFQATPPQVGAAFGTATIASMAFGLVFMVVAPKRLYPRLGVKTPVWLLVRVNVLAALMLALLWAAGSLSVFFVIMGLHLAFVIVGSMVVLSLVQDLAPPSMRARLAAITLMIQASCAALSPPLVGWLSDHLPQPGGALNAMLGVALFGFVVSTWTFWLCSQVYESGVRAAQAHDAS